MIVLRWTRTGTYILGELDGLLSKLCFAAFRLLPYYTQLLKSVPVTTVQYSNDELEEMTYDANDTDSNEGDL